MDSTEQKILEAAEKVFIRKGYAKTRLQEIANLAGVNNPLLHYYFRTKDKLYQKVLERQLQKLRKPLEHFDDTALPPWEALDKFIQDVWKIYTEDPKIFRWTLSASEDFRDTLLHSSLKNPREIPFLKNLLQTETLPRNLSPELFLLQVLTLTYFPPLTYNLFFSYENQNLIDDYYIQLPATFRRLLQK